MFPPPLLPPVSHLDGPILITARQLLLVQTVLHHLRSWLLWAVVPLTSQQNLRRSTRDQVPKLAALPPAPNLNSSNAHVPPVQRPRPSARPAPFRCAALFAPSPKLRRRAILGPSFFSFGGRFPVYLRSGCHSNRRGGWWVIPLMVILNYYK